MNSKTTNECFLYAHLGGKNKQVQDVLGSDYQRATRITYTVQRFEIIADGGSFALQFSVEGVTVTTAPLNLLSFAKDDITKAIVDATGGVNTPFTDWTYFYHCSLPKPFNGCYWSHDAGTVFSDDPNKYDSALVDRLIWDLFWVMDYKGGQSGFRVAGDTNYYVPGPLYNGGSKSATFWLIFFGPASSSLSDIKILTRFPSFSSTIHLTKHSLNPPSPITFSTYYYQRYHS